MKLSLDWKILWIYKTVYNRVMLVDYFWCMKDPKALTAFLLIEETLDLWKKRTTTNNYGYTNIQLLTVVEIQNINYANTIIIYSKFSFPWTTWPIYFGETCGILWAKILFPLIINIYQMLHSKLWGCVWISVELLLTFSF